jgi:hypothetical protein
MEGLNKFGRAQDGDGCRNCRYVVHFDIVNGGAVLQLFANSFHVSSVAIIFQPKLDKADAEGK